MDQRRTSSWVSPEVAFKHTHVVGGNGVCTDVPGVRHRRAVSGSLRTCPAHIPEMEMQATVGRSYGTELTDPADIIRRLSFPQALWTCHGVIALPLGSTFPSSLLHFCWNLFSVCSGNSVRAVATWLRALQSPQQIPCCLALEPAMETVRWPTLAVTSSFVNGLSSVPAPAERRAP